MKPRITLNLTADGELEIWLNPEGRDLLVGELQHLNERWEHFHMAAEDMGEVAVSIRPYRPTDKLLQRAKVLFRTDEWDREYFPHVLEENE
jgi:hypothetical protein